jgi:hypothetical protein
MDAEGDDFEDEELIEMARNPLSVEVNGDRSASFSTTVNTATLPHLLTTLSLPQRLISLSSLTPLSFPPSSSTPSPHPPTTAALSTFHLRALEALNNLLLTVAASLPADLALASQAAGILPAQQIWEKLFAIVGTIAAEPEVLASRGQEMRGEVLEMALGCLWGVSKVSSAQLVGHMLARRGQAAVECQGVADDVLVGGHAPADPGSHGRQLPSPNRDCEDEGD